MHENESEYYIVATKKEIAQLAKQKTWERVNCNDIPTRTYGKPCRILKGK